MTSEEFKYYSDIARRLFSYMNGRINYINNNCILNIETYDFISDTCGYIRYPNVITIFLGSIIDSWDKYWERYMDKVSFVVTYLSWSIAHELFHADQCMSLVMYSTNDEYKKGVELDVEKASHDWVYINQKELSKLVGVNIQIEGMKTTDMLETSNYREVTVATFYKQTIANVLLRSIEIYNQLKVFTDDSIVTDIIITFNGTDDLIIKSNGKYLEECVELFSRLVFKWAGNYDRYTIYAETTIYEHAEKEGVYTVARVNFIIENRSILPIIFKNGKDVYQ